MRKKDIDRIATSKQQPESFLPEVFDPLVNQFLETFIGVVLRENRRVESYGNSSERQGQDAACGQGLVGAADSYRNHRYIEFLAENGKGLFEFAEGTVDGACPLRKNHDIFTALQQSGHLLDRLADIGVDIHDHDVVMVGQKPQPTVWQMFGLGIKEGPLHQRVFQSSGDKETINETLVVGGQDAGCFRNIFPALGPKAEVAGKKYAAQVFDQVSGEPGAWQGPIDPFPENIAPIDQLDGDLFFFLLDEGTQQTQGRVQHQLVFGDLNTKGFLEKNEQADLVQGVESCVDLEMIIGGNAPGSMDLNEFLDDPIFLATWRLRLRLANLSLLHQDRELESFEFG